MCLEHEGFRQLLKSPGFTKPLVSIVIDEAHCITQWGGEFRMTYDKLADLRSYIPMDIPFLATSAMLAPAAVQQVQAKLQINPQRSYFINLGNDCPNITPSVVKMIITLHFCRWWPWGSRHTKTWLRQSSLQILSSRLTKLSSFYSRTYQMTVDHMSGTITHCKAPVPSTVSWKPFTLGM